VPESLAAPAPAGDEAGEPAPAAPPEPEPYAPSELAIGGPADGDGRFAVQVGAFANPANSRGMLETLARRGYDAYVVELAGNRRTLHTVRFGRFAEHAQAAQAAADFRRREGMDAVVQESDTL
jgi:cell division septation protein DedD